MSARSIRVVHAVGLLFVCLALGACSTNSSFWDRSPRVGGARQLEPAPAPMRPPPEVRPTPPPSRAPSGRPPTTTVSPGARPEATSPATGEEQAMLAIVNGVRAQHSLRPLRFHPTLWVAARDHSLEQDRHGYMGHGSPDPRRARLAQRMALAGYEGRVFAEVVAWGYTSTHAVVEGWMNSADHRRILLDPELTEGAFSRAGQYWTGNLGAPRRFAVSAPPARGYGRAPGARPLPRRTPAPSRRPAAVPAPRAAAPVPRTGPPKPPAGFG